MIEVNILWLHVWHITHSCCFTTVAYTVMLCNVLDMLNHTHLFNSTEVEQMLTTWTLILLFWFYLWQYTFFLHCFYCGHGFLQGKGAVFLVTVSTKRKQKQHNKGKELIISCMIVIHSDSVKKHYFKLISHTNTHNSLINRIIVQHNFDSFLFW